MQCEGVEKGGEVGEVENKGRDWLDATAKNNEKRKKKDSQCRQRWRGKTRKNGAELTAVYLLRERPRRRQGRKGGRKKK